jgi:hypothetical protein
MTLMSIIVPMIGLIIYGKNIKELKTKHFIIAAVVAILQLSVVVFKMFTMEKPPMF